MPAFDPFRRAHHKTPLPDISKAIARDKREAAKVAKLTFPAILVDKAETLPWHFPPEYTTESVVLNVGDYALKEDYEDCGIVLERKALGDAMKSLTWDRPRFDRELVRMEPFRSKHLVIESTKEEFLTEARRIGEASMIGTVLSIASRGIVIAFVGNKAGGAKYAIDIFTHYYRHKCEDAAAASAAAMEHPPAE